MTLQQSAINFGYLGLFAVAGRTVVYSSPTVGVATVSAVVGKSPDSVSTEFGVLISSLKDYIIKAADLILIGSSGSSGTGELVTPQVGDTITEANGDVYEVVLANGVDCFNYPDPDKEWLRIHTQEI